MMRVVVAIAFAACNSGGAALTDALSIDAFTGPVEVTVLTATGDGQPDLGARVVFYDAADNVVFFAPVGPDGRAVHPLTAGSSVAVVRTLTSAAFRSVSIHTIRDVEPGDRITLGVAASASYRAGATDRMSVQYTPLSTSSGPYMMTPCATATQVRGPGSPYTLLFHESCAKPTFDLFTVADDAQSRYFIWQPDIAYVPGSTITLPDAWQPMGSLATTYTNGPSEPTEISEWLYMLIDNIPFEVERRQATLQPGGTTTTHLHAPGAGDRILYMARRAAGITIVDDYSVVAASTVTSLPIDLAALPLPTFASPARQVADGVTWTETPAGTPDARFVNWSAQWTKNGVERVILWTVMEKPSSASSVKLLPLPMAYADDDPTQAGVDVVLRSANVSYVDYDTSMATPPRGNTART